MLRLAIAYQEETKLLSLCTVDDPQLLRRVAHAAVREAERMADETGRTDPTLGEIRRSEAVRLRSVFRQMLPGFDSPQTSFTHVSM